MEGRRHPAATIGTLQRSAAAAKSPLGSRRRRQPDGKPRAGQRCPVRAVRLQVSRRYVWVPRRACSKFHRASESAERAEHGRVEFVGVSGGQLACAFKRIARPVFLLLTAGLAVLMFTEPAGVFLMLSTVVTIVLVAAGTGASALWFLSVLRKLGLRLRFAPT